MPVEQKTADDIDQLWKLTDKNGNGLLDTQELSKMLKKLNFECSSQNVQSLCQSANLQQKKEYNKNEFRQIYQHLKLNSNQAIRLYFTHCVAAGSGDGASATKDQFKQWLVNVQGVSGHVADQVVGGVTGDRVAFAQFCQFLFSDQNNAYDVQKRRIYQDMTKPWTWYYINSSHNTYLTGNQLDSKSSTSSYVNALRMGCRCVELDVWDGQDNQPVILHGHTLTSKILFKDVLIAIKENAFLVSEYPVVLSLEVHTGVEQQVVMANLLTEVFGDSLVAKPLHEEQQDHVPSPEQLKRKIIVKTKRHSVKADKIAPVTVASPDRVDADGKQQQQQLDDASSSGSSSGSESDSSLSTKSPQSKSTVGEKSAEKQSSGNGGKPKLGGGLFSKLLPGNKKKQDNDSSKTKDASSVTPSSVDSNTDSEAKKKLKVATELASLAIYMQSKKFKSFKESSGEFNGLSIASLSENKALKLIRKGSKSDTLHEFINFTIKAFARIYPKGTRIDSSNIDPQVYWMVGCQMAALNLQHHDQSLEINHGLFLQNGNCGYVLKTDQLLPDKVSGTPKLFRQLRVTVLGGFKLPKPNLEMQGEIIDPYVEVSVIAPSPSEELGIVKMVSKTPQVNNNGLTPVWAQDLDSCTSAQQVTQKFASQSFNFDQLLSNPFAAVRPELTFLRFNVIDEDVGKDQLLAYAAIPLNCLSKGLRTVQLYTPGANLLQDSFLTVFIDLK
ncbi:hypothetical protein MIR68_011887 [Amoeboaphelidium protococcarum]|nr:hypothetical protein MIR68_011887 [Amoeboaphelidium protococcarum]